MTERLPFHFSLSCIGEGNGNPLQCSCLGNPRDGGAWWAAVSGVAQSRTRLKRLSSSSSRAFWASLVAESKESACNAGDLGWILGWEDHLEKGTATHSSILTWRIPWTEEAVELQFKGRKESDKTEWPTHKDTAFHILARLCSKSFKLGLSRMWTKSFQMYKLGLEKEDEPEVKLPTFVGSWRKQASFIETSTSASFTKEVFDSVDHNKLWKSTRPPYLSPEKPVYRSRSNTLNLTWNNWLAQN